MIFAKKHPQLLISGTSINLTLGTLVTCLLSNQVLAHEPHTPVPALEEIFVFGRSTQLLGIADSASQGVVGYDDIQRPPLLRVGELAEAVPGMVATQHSGTGKANQYFLRGFNLDHGTDFSAHIEGVPLNMRSHGHGQGYLDLNFLIPELVSTTNYRKGPYKAGDGDFSSAGSVDFTYYDVLQESVLELTLGENAYSRALFAGSPDIASGNLTLALDATRYAGPWHLEENLEQEKFYAAYATEIAGTPVKFDLQGYFSDWDATDQIPLRAVESGLIDDLGFIDPDLGGKSHRLAFNTQADFGSVRVNAYAVDSDFTLFSNFTYLLENPVEGDEFEQRDKRRIYGARLREERTLPELAVDAVFNWGADVRFDDIEKVALYPTASRQRIGITRADAIQESSLSAFAEVKYPINTRFRATLGMRADYYHWDVTANQTDNSGQGEEWLVSPKLALAYRLANSLEAYANFGRGMHSNDVRGATISVDPATGLAAQPVDVLVPTRGSELGLRYEPAVNFNTTLALFQLDTDSELVFVGDAGGTEVNDGSHRYGIEAAWFWQANQWLALNGDYSRTRARFRNAVAGEDHIPGAIESAYSAGGNVAWPNGISASLQIRYLGGHPLIEDNSVRAASSTLTNFSLAFDRGRFQWRVDAFNLLDSDDRDISYLYASRLPGEPAAGVEDIHFHPLEPRTLRFSVQYKL